MIWYDRRSHDDLGGSASAESQQGWKPSARLVPYNYSKWMLSPPSRLPRRASGGGSRQLILSVYLRSATIPRVTRWNSYTRIVFPEPATHWPVRTCDRVTKIILPSPGHHNISDVPSCHSLNSQDSRNHSPVPFLVWIRCERLGSWERRASSRLPDAHHLRMIVDEGQSRAGTW